MAGVGLVSHPRCLEHFAGPAHPERPDRLSAVLERLRADGLTAQLAGLEASEADIECIQAVHETAYVESVIAACATGRAMVDQGDTYVSSESHRAALRAAGGTIDACRKVLAGEWTSAFCAVRPPGHHAEEQGAMGFCLYNNVAVAARWLRSKGVERVAIVDWDVHHGNGTQHTFERDATVFYASMHQYPFYPGTGAKGERGLGAGAGTTLNCPLAAGAGDAEWIAAFESELLPALEDFAPEFVLVSAGFDAHRDDPLAGMRLSEEAYRAMTRSLLELADRSAHGRLVSLLEGGYDLEALSRSVAAHVETLLLAAGDVHQDR
jgi:acetoin utilization deacetylase AcuC-like enzyme